MAVKHSAEVTVYDVSDLYGVTLTNEAATFKATSDTKLGTQSTATTKPQAFQGSDPIACSVTAADCVCSDSTNVSVSVNSSGDNVTWPLITVTVGANATAGGTVTIPVVIGSGSTAVIIEKVFSYAISLKGTKGDTGTRGAVWYTGTAITGTSTTPTIFSGSGITSAIIGDMYLNTSTGNTYRCTVAGNASTAKWVYVENLTGPTGQPGAAGAAGGKWYTGTGITGTSTTETIFSGSGVSSAVVGDMYLNTSTSNYYRCTVAGDPSTAKWVYAGNSKGAKGDKGDHGDNPYTVSITTDNGNVIRNNTGQTTMTAHVYQEGVELNTMPTGCSIKWYVNGTLTETDTTLPATFTRTAAQVSGNVVIRAQLEG